MVTTPGFWSSAKAGAVDSAPFCVSTFLFGILFGVAASAVDFDLVTGLLMSGATFSATAQFAALELWQHPLPLFSILLSVFLVSSRNILLGLSVTNHLDGHSLPVRMLCISLLSDPSVVMILRRPTAYDNLGYMIGYGIALWISWMVSVWAGFSFSSVFASTDPESFAFAGPLVMTTMMMLFVKSDRGQAVSWTVSGTVALMLAMLSLDTYLILPLSVVAGVTALVIRQRVAHV